MRMRPIGMTTLAFITLLLLVGRGTFAGEHPGGPAPGSEHPGAAAPTATPPPPATPATPAKPATSATPAAPAAKPEEHPGKVEGQEHPGTPQEHPGAPAKPKKQSRVFTAPEIKAAMLQHIQTTTQRGGGVFTIHDPVQKRDLQLRFVKIHDPVRQVAGRGYFACADFQTTDGATVYDLDVWLAPNGEILQPTEIVIHKVAGKARFTYANDRPVPVQ